MCLEMKVIILSFIPAKVFDQHDLLRGHWVLIWHFTGTLSKQIRNIEIFHVMVGVNNFDDHTAFFAFCCPFIYSK